jgi:[ribosomal protein S18]-alanine N-acetyltransferase
MEQTPKTELDISIRPALSSDIPAILQLEHAIFADPWPESAFLEQLDDDNWGTIVAETNSTIIGYACWMIADVEAHLTNIAVAPEYRRKSVARILLDRILMVASRAGCEYLLLEVRPSNRGAVVFYEKHGFSVLYQRPNYYRRPPEDALVMVRYLAIRQTGD